MQHFLPGGPFALLPLPGDRVSLVWSDERRKVASLMAMDEAGFTDRAQPPGWPRAGLAHA
jgi:2-octaprenyl-6-methoxyphenol hydroxylase